jgi:hypothetical protein
MKAYIIFIQYEIMMGVLQGPDIIASGIRANQRDKLLALDLSDQELKRIYECANDRFGDVKIHTIFIADQPREFYIGAASLDILRERHGPTYIEELTGVRQPFSQKASYRIREISIPRLKRYAHSTRDFLNRIYNIGLDIGD